QATDPTTGKPVPAVSEFMIEYDACMSCGLCAEVCPFDASKMDHEFELATDDHGSMTVNKAGLDRPVSYYEALAPRMWSEVKDGAYKKLQGNMKRRSGTIGISPRVQGKAGKVAPAVAKPTAAAAAPAAPAKPAAPVAAVGKNMSDEKLARLMAIRAAKAGGAPAPAAAPAPAEVPVENGAAEEVVPVATATARPATTGGLPFSADNLLGGVPASTAMSEDKVERLKAIRSGNLERRG